MDHVVVKVVPHLTEAEYLDPGVNNLLKGHVELELTKPVLVRDVFVNFCQEIFLKLVDKECGGFWKRKQRRRYVFGTELLFALPSGTPYRLFDAGIYYKEFAMRIPKNLPSTFHGSGRVSSIFYVCIANLLQYADDGSLKQHSHLKPILIRQSIPRDQCLAYRTEASAHGVLHVTNIWDMSGSVDALVYVNRRSFYPSESVVFSLEIGNCYRNIIVSASLRETVHFYEAGNSLRQRSSDLVRIQIGTVRIEFAGWPKHGVEWNFRTEQFRRFKSCCLWIPDLLPLLQKGKSPSVPGDSGPSEDNPQSSCSVVSKWSFVVTAKMWTGRALMVEIPIEILIPSTV